MQRVSPFQKQAMRAPPAMNNLFTSRGPFSSDEGAAVLAFCATGQIRSGTYGKFMEILGMGQLKLKLNLNVEVAVPST